jgi:MFS family permease
MLIRFCLYGFLKNQKYYEPFLILALRDKGLSFFMIGLLIGFRQVCVNLLEIPTGVVADMYGRRRSMIASFAAYIVSFAIFAVSPYVWTLFAAMLFFAVGEAFRTGTHKAMIFDWLVSEDKADQKTKYYGFTRSWSQLGSALSVLIAAAAVCISEDYVAIFWISIIPYVMNIVNFLGYPAFLDGETTHAVSIGGVFRKLMDVLRDSIHNVRLRRLFVESMTYKGSYTVAKEYLQPLLKQTALALPFLLNWAEQKRAALLVGAVFFVLYLLSSVASRTSHAVSNAARGDEPASRILWVVNLLLYAGLIPALWYDLHWVAIAAFVLIAILQNTWRPIVMSRIDSCSDAKVGATVLSIDSQAESFFVMIMAPLLGLAVDRFGLWPVGAFGAAAAFVMTLSGAVRSSRGTSVVH